MRLLLDTHILIWLIMEDRRLDLADQELIFDPDTVALVSSLSIWEVRLKHNSAGRRPRDSDIPIDPETTLEACRRLNLGVVNADAEDFTVQLRPALSHRDPFDEMLVVHAQRLGARLLTRDEKLVDHPVAYRP